MMDTGSHVHTAIPKTYGDVPMLSRNAQQFLNEMPSKAESKQFKDSLG
jgi:hypothetical protein